MHTSAASVAVLPQADEMDVSIRDEDLRIDTYRCACTWMGGTAAVCSMGCLLGDCTKCPHCIALSA